MTTIDTKEIDIWTRLNECEVVKKVRFPMEIGDRLFFKREDGTIHKYTFVSGGQPSSDDLWIVPLFDETSPERSLIGIAETMFRNVILRMVAVSYWECVIIRHDKSEDITSSDRLDLALVLAIIREQEEK